MNQPQTIHDRRWYASRAKLAGVLVGGSLLAFCMLILLYGIEFANRGGHQLILLDIWPLLPFACVGTGAWVWIFLMARRSDAPKFIRWLEYIFCIPVAWMALLAVGALLPEQAQNLPLFTILAGILSISLLVSGVKNILRFGKLTIRSIILLVIGAALFMVVFNSILMPGF